MNFNEIYGKIFNISSLLLHRKSIMKGFDLINFADTIHSTRPVTFIWFNTRGGWKRKENGLHTPEGIKSTHLQQSSWILPFPSWWLCSFMINILNPLVPKLYDSYTWVVRHMTPVRTWLYLHKFSKRVDYGVLWSWCIGVKWCLWVVIHKNGKCA